MCKRPGDVPQLPLDALAGGCVCPGFASTDTHCCQAPRGRFRKAAQMSGSLKHYPPHLFPPSLERKLQLALPLGPPHFVLTTCPIFLQPG